MAGGAWLLQQQITLPGSGGLFLLLPAALLCGYGVLHGSSGLRSIARGASIGVAVAAGFLWAGFVAQGRLADRLDPQWEDRELSAVGVIASLPEPGEHGSRFLFDVEQVAPADARVPQRVSLNWTIHDLPAVALEAGQRWKLTLRLRRPHGNSNPHGFDYEAWLFEQGIRATGSVRADPPPSLMTASVASAAHAIERLRDGLRTRVLDALAQAPCADVLVALVMGDQHAITPEHWRVFTRTGINHLMSISGLHITMLGALGYLLVRAIWRMWPRLALLLAAQRAAVVGGALAAWFYALLSGFAVPAQRTVLMLSVVAVALWLGLNIPASALLAIALIAVVALDPMAVLSAGFWLSFASVAILMFVTSGFAGRVPWYATWGRTQWAISVALTPILLMLFQQVSLVSPIANLFAVPIVSFVVVPLALLGSVVNSPLLLELAQLIMSWLMLPLTSLAEAPAAVWGQHAPALWTVFPALCGVVWLLLPRGVPARWVGCVLLSPLFLDRPAGPEVNEMWLQVLDVGQGLAVVARTREHALLFDTGPRYSSNTSAGDHVVVPFLRGEGVTALDRLVISHDDSDHTGGAAAVLRALPVTQILTSVKAEKYSPHPTARCEDGAAWEWDGVRFEILHPAADSYSLPQLKNNDRSCVLKIVSRFGSALITGDIEKSSEMELLHRLAPLQTDVLVVPHHGSGTSSTPAFIDRVQPQLALFAVGYHNRFGHPKYAVLQRYRQAGARILRSDYDGSIGVRFSAHGLETTSWRRTAQHYWSGQ
jgi:competence protein ComEC